MISRVKPKAENDEMMFKTKKKSGINLKEINGEDVTLKKSTLRQINICSLNII